MTETTNNDVGFLGKLAKLFKSAKVDEPDYTALHAFGVGLTGGSITLSPEGNIESVEYKQAMSDDQTKEYKGYAQSVQRQRYLAHAFLGLVSSISHVIMLWLFINFIGA